MRLAGLVLGVLVACGGSPPPVPTFSPDQNLDAWDAANERDALWVRLDMRQLRALGWLPVVRQLVDGDATPDACGFDVWNDSDRVAVSVDAGGDLIGALTTSVDLSTLRCGDLLGRFASGRASGDAQPRLERVGDVWLVGAGARLDDAKRRLAAHVVSPLGPDTLLAMSGSVEERTIARLAITMAGSERHMQLSIDVVPAKQSDAASATNGVVIKRRLAALAASVRAQGQDAAPLADALDDPDVRLSARGVTATVVVDTTPALRRLLAERADVLFDDRVAQCNRLVDAINGQQQALQDHSGDSAEAVRKLAEALLGVSDAVGLVKLGDQRLIALRDAYTQMARDLSRAAEGTAAAMEADDAVGTAEAAEHMGSFGEREAALVDEINQLCDASP